MKALVILLVLVLMVDSTEIDSATQRLEFLRKTAAESPDNVIRFTNEYFNEYALKYPRPYDLVIYLGADSSTLSKELTSEYKYLVNLYTQFGAMEGPNPTFFAQVNFNRDVEPIFTLLNFNTAPNLMVSKPYMAVVSQVQRKQYLQKFKWSISYTDGHVTTHKMLEFVNKRTGKEVPYKPTLATMLKTFFGFIAVAVLGVIVYTKLKFLWTNWVVWFVGSILIYITCCSGVVYDIIHEVPFVGRDPKTGETTIFSDGNREQYGAEGLVISLSLTFIGLLFIAIMLSGEKLKRNYNFIFGLGSLVVIYWIVSQLEQLYKAKSWYGPSFYPPQNYKAGPLSVDQGNNI